MFRLLIFLFATHLLHSEELCLFPSNSPDD